MKHFFSLSVVLLLIILMVVSAGCSCSNDLEACRRENQTLKQQVTDLQQQLRLADQAALAGNAVGLNTSIYLVVEGDSLWSIANRQLGSGTRYKEILALNPQLTRDTPLKIGMTLRMPAR